MPKMYEYQGRQFQLPDGLSDAQAKDKIISFLATEQTTRAREAARAREAGNCSYEF